MNYHPEDFLRLILAVEESGGTGLPDPCRPIKYRLKVPREGGQDPQWTDFFTTGCGKETRFVLPYEPQEPVMLPNSDMLSNTVESGKEDRRVRQALRATKKSSPVVSDTERDQQLARGAGFVTVCAVDDNMGAWPRFQHLMQEDTF